MLDVAVASGDGAIGVAGVVEGVVEGTEAGVEVGVADGTVDEERVGVVDGLAEGGLVGAGGPGGGSHLGGSNEWRELSGATGGSVDGGLPVGELVVVVGAVGVGSGASVVALSWNGEGAVIPICLR